VAGDMCVVCGKKLMTTAFENGVLEYFSTCYGLIH
jgi:hypothetical protein